MDVVIGKETRYLNPVEDAKDCVSHDVSECGFQLECGGQLVEGKSWETFNPLGSWPSTAGEVPNLQRLDMFLDMNSERRQTGNTCTMIFGCLEIVRYISQFMTLGFVGVFSKSALPGVGQG